MDKLIFANHIVAESIFEESTFEIACVNCAHGHYLWRRVWNKPCNCPTKNSMNYSCPMVFTSLGQDIMIGILLPPPIPPPILKTCFLPMCSCAQIEINCIVLLHLWSPKSKRLEIEKKGYKAFFPKHFKNILLKNDN